MTTSLAICSVLYTLSSHKHGSVVDAFSVQQQTSTVPSTSKTPFLRPTTTSLFLFSLRNTNNGENSIPDNDNDDEKKDEGTTTTMERKAEETADDDNSDDFVAWMEGLKFGTPLGKMTAASSTTTLPTTAVPSESSADNSSPPGDEPSKPKATSRTKAPSEYISSVNLSDSTMRQPKVNPLSNLIQFEAMLELAKIAGSKNSGVQKDGDDTSATDVFAVVDRLVQTFQKQEQAKQKPTEQKELLQLAQLEEATIQKATQDILEQGEATDDLDGVTTVKDLIELESYIDKFSFRKVSSIWDTFSGKENDGLVIDDNVDSDDGIVAPRPPEGLASSSVLFRKTQGPPPKPTTPSLQDLVGRATISTGTTVESISNDIVAAALKIAKESGVELNVQFAADRAKEATEYAVGVANTANVILDAGYAYGSRSGAAGMTGRDDDLSYLAASGASRSVLAKGLPHQAPLFGAFDSAQRIEPYEYSNVLHQGARMGALAGAIYEDSLARSHELGHSLVANGTTANVAWMVTDSIMDYKDYQSAFRHHEDDERKPTVESASTSPVMIRTITLRGFDASDESVDREALLSEICLATPVAMDEETANTVVFHKGLLDIARQIYKDTKQFIDWASPNTKIVLNGHSVGGSLSVLMLLLITRERGVDFVRDRIPRVYSHGSPPIATMVSNGSEESNAEKTSGGTQRCRVLEAFGLPSSTVYSFIQPYDPVIRLFSNHDVLYPLVDDLGNDGITLYSSGPIRSLRPITRAIFKAWNGWPQFRDNWKGTCDTQHHSVGIQHLLLPEPLRYLNDRFISVNVGVPPVDAIVRISPKDLLPALDETFPLDTFQVSLVPQAVRSFLHHFYPAYDAAITDFANKIEKEDQMDPVVQKKSGAFKPFLTTQSIL